MKTIICHTIKSVLWGTLQILIKSFKRKPAKYTANTDFIVVLQLPNLQRKSATNTIVLEPWLRLLKQWEGQINDILEQSIHEDDPDNGDDPIGKQTKPNEIHEDDPDGGDDPIVLESITLEIHEDDPDEGDDPVGQADTPV